MIRRVARALVLLVLLACTALAPHPAHAQQRATLNLEVGGGQLVTLPQAASTVFAADPRIANVQAASPTTLFISGVARGRTVVVAAAADGREIATYEVVVGGQRPAGPAGAGAPAAALPAVEAAIRAAVPAVANLSLRRVPGGVLVAGEVPTAADAQRVLTIVRAGLPENDRVIDDLKTRGPLQVNLRVRVAEVSREVTRQLGISWDVVGRPGASFTFRLLNNAILGGAVAPVVGAGVASPSFAADALIDALAQDRLITILAEPNLTAQSGETASFLAGGEFPVPVGASFDRITIEFKQFGVSLAFVPTVLSDERINLRVRPEVSELSEEGAISLPLAGGVVSVPALRVRRAETTVELGSGQSFAIAGLFQDGARIAASGLPFLGEVPVLGALFRSDRFRRNESELVIIVTPYIVRPVSEPRALALPTDGLRPANDIERLLLLRQVSRDGAPRRVPGRAGFILD